MLLPPNALKNPSPLDLYVKWLVRNKRRTWSEVKFSPIMAQDIIVGYVRRWFGHHAVEGYKHNEETELHGFLRLSRRDTLHKLLVDFGGRHHFHSKIIGGEIILQFYPRGQHRRAAAEIDPATVPAQHLEIVPEQHLEAHPRGREVAPVEVGKFKHYFPQFPKIS